MSAAARLISLTWRQLCRDENNRWDRSTARQTLHATPTQAANIARDTGASGHGRLPYGWRYKLLTWQASAIKIERW